jgi:hypothetical protein
MAYESFMKRFPLDYQLKSAKEVVVRIENDIEAAHNAADHFTADILEGVLDHAKKELKGLEIKVNAKTV